MLHVSIKGILVCLTFVNVRFDGVFGSAGNIKIQWFDTFLRCKSNEGGYRISYSSTLKLSVRRRLKAVYIF